jgi:hypothetical protein
MYQAMNAERYLRQARIKQIQEASDGLQCWIVCDGVTPTHPVTGEYEPSRSTDVKKFVDLLCLQLLSIIAEATKHPIPVMECLKRANSWVREYNQANGFKYTVPGLPSPFGATTIIAITAAHTVNWASLGDCFIAASQDHCWKQLNRHQTEDVQAAIEAAGCKTFREKVRVVARLRNHKSAYIKNCKFRGFGVLNGDEQSTQMIEFGSSDAAHLILGSDGIRSALLDNCKTLRSFPIEPDPSAIKTWFESPGVSESSTDDKTLIMLAR